MSTTTDETEIAIAARASSATVRASLTRLRASMEIVTDRLATLSASKKRALIARGCVIVIDSWKVREAAKRLPQTATSMPFLIQIETETASLMNSGAAYLHRLTENRYLGHDPLDTALMVARDLEFTEPSKAKPKNTAALRGAAARAAFDRARRAVVIRSDEEDASANDQAPRCPECGQILPADTDAEDEANNIGGPSKGLRRHKHTTARALAVVKRAGADAPLTFTGLASSTAIDRMADRFSQASLITMSRAFPNTPIHVDHSFKMADLVGKTLSATLKKNADGETDLWIVGELDKSNPKAVQAFNAIKNGLPVSLSVGVIVLSQTKTSDTLRGQPVWQIEDVEPLEISLVSLPALARARVTSASE